VWYYDKRDKKTAIAHMCHSDSKGHQTRCGKILGEPSRTDLGKIMGNPDQVCAACVSLMDAVPEDQITALRRGSKKAQP
jgi:hypothetical protein